jgi:hypothetical protein
MNVSQGLWKINSQMAMIPMTPRRAAPNKARRLNRFAATLFVLGERVNRKSKQSTASSGNC